MEPHLFGKYTKMNILYFFFYPHDKPALFKTMVPALGQPRQGRGFFIQHENYSQKRNKENNEGN